jgi:hypothetical protein
MHVFSHVWKTNPKINIGTKPSIIIYKLDVEQVITVE